MLKLLVQCAQKFKNEIPKKNEFKPKELKMKQITIYINFTSNCTIWLRLICKDFLSTSVNRNYEIKIIICIHLLRRGNFKIMISTRYVIIVGIIDWDKFMITRIIMMIGIN